MRLLGVFDGILTVMSFTDIEFDVTTHKLFVYDYDSSCQWLSDRAFS